LGEFSPLLIEKNIKIIKSEIQPVFQTSQVEDADGINNLKFLMDQNNLKQKDLVGIIGAKSAVSEILNGKRPFNLNHIHKLAKKFNVRPATVV
jgi:HTH-type transcriptional regulator / antitoxin HigA